MYLQQRDLNLSETNKQTNKMGACFPGYVTQRGLCPVPRKCLWLFLLDLIMRFLIPVISFDARSAMPLFYNTQPYHRLDHRDWCLNWMVIKKTSQSNWASSQLRPYHGSSKDNFVSPRLLPHSTSVVCLQLACSFPLSGLFLTCQCRPFFFLETFLCPLKQLGQCP